MNEPKYIKSILVLSNLIYKHLKRTGRYNNVVCESFYLNDVRTVENEVSFRSEENDLLVGFDCNNYFYEIVITYADNSGYYKPSIFNPQSEPELIRNYYHIRDISYDIELVSNTSECYKIDPESLFNESEEDEFKRNFNYPSFINDFIDNSIAYKNDFGKVYALSIRVADLPLVESLLLGVMKCLGINT